MLTIIVAILPRDRPLAWMPAGDIVGPSAAARHAFPSRVLRAHGDPAARCSVLVLMDVTVDALHEAVAIYKCALFYQ